jgi:hypothetical protein
MSVFRNFKALLSMKNRFILLLILTGLLSSCSSYEFKSAHNEEHPCYSIWNWHPQNS